VQKNQAADIFGHFLTARILPNDLKTQSLLIRYAMVAFWNGKCLILPVGASMKKSVEKFGDFEIVWMSVSRIGDAGSQGQGLNSPVGNDRNNVIVFIDGWEWLRRETKRVRVHVLSPRSEAWGSQLIDSISFLEDLERCVRIVLKDSDGELEMEVKNITYTWANA
jgi:hypothetical protein